MIRTRQGWLRAIHQHTSLRELALHYDRIGKVKLIHTNELHDDEWLWAIVAMDEQGNETDFWMEAFIHEHDARNFCQVMNWDIVD